MSKKVGIITFHEALNYGAILQAYALKTVCETLGFEAHIVNYNYGGIEEKIAPIRKYLSAPSKKAALPALLRGLLGFFYDKKREKAFSSFREKYLNESPACASPADICALGYDVLIAGSDQIWNRGITMHRYDPVFFMNFDTTAKKILYAASSEDVPFSGEKEEAFLNALRGLQGAVSIREQKLANYVHQLTGQTYPTVLDPTLLAGRNFLDTIVLPDPPAQEYILLYQIDSNPESDISVKRLEARFGCSVYTMTTPRIGDTYHRKGEAGPEVFLSLLKGAKFLVTNSFHGIALSLLMHKQFFVYENGGVMSRIDSLLALVGLNDRKVKLVADIDSNVSIPYAEVDSRLAIARETSISFLKSALAGTASTPESWASHEDRLTTQPRQKPNCCGCTACMEVCPSGAISMELDAEGFLYPEIDSTKCIHCNKCERVCGFYPFPKRKEPFDLPQAYGVKHSNLSTRESSRSGGAFVGFSDVILKRGGTIYGASMGSDFTVRHFRAITAEERDQMKGAKYVQSDIRGTYPQVAKDLKNGLDVLFSGTPCQVAGLRGYLDEQQVDTRKLCCCDIVCHGVPSPAIWKDYLSNIEKTHGRKILSANFRDKDFGWEAHCESFRLDGMKEKLAQNDYTDLFFQHIMFRPSCSVCPFTNLHRPGDLTMADFWGIEKHHVVFNDNRGVSLILVNSAVGAAVFEEARKDFICFQAHVKDCMQPSLFKPSTPSSRRDQFWQDYQSLPFSTLLHKYTTPTSIPARAKKLVKKSLYRLGLRQHP